MTVIEVAVRLRPSAERLRRYHSCTCSAATNLSGGAVPLSRAWPSTADALISLDGPLVICNDAPSTRCSRSMSGLMVTCLLCYNITVLHLSLYRIEKISSVAFKMISCTKKVYFNINFPTDSDMKRNPCSLVSIPHLYGSIISTAEPS